ncbi:MAG: type I-U CRISPR-associated helicase/endonuclease Cas3 [Isosphaeraceae bacterium]
MADDPYFQRNFRELTGNNPFPWQQAMYRRMVNGDPPESCQIPTGLGKTSVIAVWLIALANNPALVPRRLVYVVNRRTVVDQSTEEARKLRDNLKNMEELKAKLGGGELAISTLRGQFADNREWSADPSRPAVIVGTVDMIGSRLLFRGYGIGFKSKPLHAGFLGQDALLVHDEAHLEPAFQELLISIKKEQVRSKDFRSFHVMELSATSRGDGAFGLGAEDRARSDVRQRIEAKKNIILHAIDDEKKLPDRLAELALQHQDSNCTVLVFARGVEAVEKVAEALRKGKQKHVETLTGTMRGKERDALVETDVFKRFLTGAGSGDETVYLVCTSAGEVGVNISADQLICDLSTFESMAQRFGRVNRFGTRDDTQIDIVHPTSFKDDDDYENARAKTLELLRDLNGDGSPAALGALDMQERLEAFSPRPKILCTSDILYDAWALTTVRDELPGRPPVEPYLHGEPEKEMPETYVAWREEVGVIDDLLAKRHDPEDLLADYPLKPHELLRDRSDRVFNRLSSLAKRHPTAPAWLVDQDGTVHVRSLEYLADKEQKDRINNRTVLLPPAVGGLSGGMLTGNPNDAADDVADTLPVVEGQPGRRPARMRLWDREAPSGMRIICSIDTRPDDEEEAESESAIPAKRFWSWYVLSDAADDDGSKTSQWAVAWSVHTDDVTERARDILDRLLLPEAEKKAVILAARFHDLGKKRIVWQRSIGNPSPTNWLAKSGRHPKGRMKPVELTDYRHEFGSLLDVLDQPDFKELSDDQKDLVLHLIAVHHGYGRPHFPSDLAFDLEPKGRDVAAIAAEVPRRFARLQRRYGRWGLAYLESLLRAADYAASAQPSKTLEDES